MNVLIVFAHPEPRSLNASLRDVAVEQLKAEGHAVQQSDLYGMNWKAQIDRDDFPSLAADVRLGVAQASGEAFLGNGLTNDVRLEQEKLQWADAVILQFPLWWFSMPAILKGWIDRVFSRGFAYGVGEHSEKRWGDRYGEGVLAGKRAMLLVTVGGWADHYGPRGINGPIDDLLFPIHHGVLFYPGADVLPPLVVYQADRTGESGFAAVSREVNDRMRTLFSTTPIAYRRQNHGDYVIPAMTLRDDLAPGSTGLHIHEAQ